MKSEGSSFLISAARSAGAADLSPWSWMSSVQYSFSFARSSPRGFSHAGPADREAEG